MTDAERAPGPRNNAKTKPRGPAGGLNALSARRLTGFAVAGCVLALAGSGAALLAPMGGETARALPTIDEVDPAQVPTPQQGDQGPPPLDIAMVADNLSYLATPVTETNDEPITQSEPVRPAPAMDAAPSNSRLDRVSWKYLGRIAFGKSSAALVSVGDKQRIVREGRGVLDPAINEEVRIAEITPEKVTVSYNGETKEFALAERTASTIGTSAAPDPSVPATAAITPQETLDRFRAANQQANQSDRELLAERAERARRRAELARQRRDEARRLAEEDGPR